MKKISCGLGVAILSYLMHSFVRWDMWWFLAIPTWSDMERFGLVLIMIFLVCVSQAMYWFFKDEFGG